MDALVEAWGVDFSNAEMSKNGKKINLDTNREQVKIVVSPSGKYFRIYDDRFEHTNQNGYFDIPGDRGEELKVKIKREYDDDTAQGARGKEPHEKIKQERDDGVKRRDIESEVKERTHFRYE